MKDVYEAFEEHLHDMINFAGDLKLKECFLTATNLTRLCTLLGFKRGVFIAEILESVFTQVDPIFQNYAVPEDDKKQIVDNMTRNLSALLSDYKGDKARVYDILEDLRFTATEFQIRCTARLLVNRRPTSTGSDTG